MRRCHEAVADLQLDPAAEYAFGSGVPADGELMCHNDFAPWNVVWRDEEPVAILDWDLVSPGSARDDVMYAARYVTPFETDEHCSRWLGYAGPPDRWHRLEIFLREYGSTMALEEVPAAVAGRCRLTTRQVRTLAARALEPQATWVSDGTADAEDRHADWVEAHLDLMNRRTNP